MDNKELTEDNPVTKLAQLMQRMYGENIYARVINESGELHSPVITVEIELPDGRTFEASASNQKLAKKEAAEIALEEFEDQINFYANIIK